jgi:hypothetical protein
MKPFFLVFAEEKREKYFREEMAVADLPNVRSVIVDSSRRNE